MINSRINFKNFRFKKRNLQIKKYLIEITKSSNAIINSLKKDYKYSYKKLLLRKLTKYQNLRVIGMGGSVLGFKAIHSFLFSKVKKKFTFHDNIESFDKIDFKKKYLNIIISKSGNTTETIANSNLFINKKNENIFVTENKVNYLNKLAAKLKSDIIHHNNFIGGRYSVLSEVGMLPAELAGLKVENFKQFNNLIKNKKFISSLVNNVSSILHLVKKKKFNSIILNYDKNSEDLFFWYQQLVAESLGKKSKGILPIISNMPKDNHSLMQLYLDGFTNNFFTFFSVKEKNINRLNNSLILNEKKFLKNKSIQEIKLSQRKATERVFNKKLLPFRSFEIKKRDERTIGELFTFFILETILLGKSLGVNPYDQPSVELIKKETKKILA
ncbi:glucose-6-phosphate isomerase [Candidatus Pelagibacter sp. HIMB1321]|uniref:glucose-6-phosphate isomerase n=1 Tax=Candidatus Pelagibacter sp. HIMB1321 TaxID=1388755 RepID=UPI000A07E6FB|nr:glucose-6-phosphate isomerase [Candidatus Pelagibacter sp. HIMB1321]SMF70566.1 glucose-6-phosphate isomerase [Candidatus Pelagibacter sp. HIMB1321]